MLSLYSPPLPMGCPSPNGDELLALPMALFCLFHVVRNLQHSNNSHIFFHMLHLLTNADGFLSITGFSLRSAYYFYLSFSIRALLCTTCYMKGVCAMAFGYLLFTIHLLFCLVLCSIQSPVYNLSSTSHCAGLIPRKQREIACSR
jgi:hypothetical protein